MRRLLSACLFLASFGCEDDPDDLVHLHDAGTGTASVNAAAPPNAAADEDASSSE